MARYAKLNSNNVVTNVIVAEKNIIDTLPDSASYILGSFESGSNKPIANIGMVYVPSPNVFVFSPPPYPSWTLNEKFEWTPPVAYPSTAGDFIWDEETKTWKNA
jgi:hypothetical protein